MRKPTYGAPVSRVRMVVMYGVREELADLTIPPLHTSMLSRYKLTIGFELTDWEKFSNWPSGGIDEILPLSYLYTLRLACLGETIEAC